MQDASAQTVTDSRPQVLICDDDAEFSAELVEALEARGYSATALRTVSAARAAMLSPSILLLDLCMPDRDGVEILTMLAEHPRRDCFKVILISGMSEQTLSAAAMLCEVRGLELLGKLRKPVNLRALCAMLAEAGPL